MTHVLERSDLELEPPRLSPQDTALVAVVIIVSMFVAWFIVRATIGAGHSSNTVSAAVSSTSSSVRSVASAGVRPPRSSTPSTVVQTTSSASSSPSTLPALPRPAATASTAVVPTTAPRASDQPSTTAASQLPAGGGEATTGEWGHIGTFNLADSGQRQPFTLRGTTFRVAYTGPAAGLTVERSDGSSAIDLGLCQEDTCTITVQGPVDPGSYDIYVDSTADATAPWMVTIDELA